VSSSESVVRGGVAWPQAVRSLQTLVKVAFVAMLAVGCAMRLLWIGDVPYIADEPQLISNALEANAEGRWAERGLQGGKGVHYGPLPTWIYQVAVSVLTSPVEIAFFKSLLITLITVFCLWIWSRYLRAQDKWFVWVALLSPCLWFYSRDLWDNSWGVPFSIVLWTSYLYFDQKPSLRRLLLPAIMAAGILLIHLMSIPIVAAIVVHFLVKQRQWILRRWAGVLAIAALVVAVDITYFLQIAAIHPPKPPTAWSLESFLFPFFAPFYFSAADSVYFLGNSWMDFPGFSPWFAFVVRIALRISQLGVVLWAAGLVVSALHQSRRGSWAGEFSTSWAGTSEQLALLTMGFFLALSAAKGLVTHPHYFNCIWPAVFFLIWRGATFLWNPTISAPSFEWLRSGRTPTRVAVSLWMASLFLSVTAMQLRVHWGEGTRSLHYGPTVGNLWTVSEELLGKLGAQIIPVTFHARAFPHSLESLVQWRLTNSAPMGAGTASDRWLVTYRYPKETWSGEVAVVQLVDGPAQKKPNEKKPK
jgi:hypothetical protein